MTTIRPLSNRVVIEPLKAAEKTSSGLFIPDTAQTVPQEALVISIGPDVTALKQGDRVIYSPYGGTTLDYDGRSYIVIDDKDIICVVE